jgi:hypothetical protein
MGKSIADKIVDYEMGTLSEPEILELFQELVDTGMAWRLQGSYGRMANRLIEEEYIYDRTAK